MRIVVSNPDSIGDFVLRQPFYAALKAAGHELLVVVRSNVAPLVPLVAPGAAVAELVSNPYDPAFDTQAADVQQAAALARQFRPDVFCIAPYQRTAADEYLARASEPCCTVGMTGVLHTGSLDGEPGSRATWRPDRTVEVALQTHELFKSQRLCGALLGKDVKLPDPCIVLEPHQHQAAGARLQRLGILPGSFWIGCVGHSRLTSMRNWSSENWATILEHAVTRFGWRILLIGTEDERAATEAIHQRMGEAGAACENLCGLCDSLDLAIGLIHHSAGYIGRDTGPMHIAAALGKPVIAVFGGGTWPRFTPAAKKGVVLTVPLPCSPCDWWCHLQDSYCVKRVTTSSVLQAMDRLEAGELEGLLIQEQPPDPSLLVRVAREGALSARKWSSDAAHQFRKGVNDSAEQSRAANDSAKQLRVAEDENRKLLDRMHEMTESANGSAEQLRAVNEENRKLLDLVQEKTEGIQSMSSQMLASRREQEKLVRRIDALEGSLSLRLARSLRWVLQPVLKLAGKNGELAK